MECHNPCMDKLMVDLSLDLPLINDSHSCGSPIWFPSDFLAKGPHSHPPTMNGKLVLSGHLHGVIMFIDQWGSCLEDDLVLTMMMSVINVSILSYSPAVWYRVGWNDRSPTLTGLINHHHQPSLTITFSIILAQPPLFQALLLLITIVKHY